jgi:hypothetical protein
MDMAEAMGKYNNRVSARDMVDIASITCPSQTGL